MVLQSMGPVTVSMVSVSRETWDERSIHADMSSDDMWMDIGSIKSLKSFTQYECGIFVVYKESAVLPIHSRFHVNLVLKISFTDNGSVIQ